MKKTPSHSLYSKLVRIATAMLALCASLIAVTATAGPAGTHMADSINTTVNISFSINSSVINRAIGNNAQVLDSLDRIFNDVNNRVPGLILREVALDGTSSPDGNLLANLSLANRRMESIRTYLVERYALPDSVITLRGATVPWDEFRSMVSDDPRVLEIVSAGDDNSWQDATVRMNRLKRLDGGRVWQRLAREVFPVLRRSVINATVLIVRPQEPEPSETVILTSVTEPEQGTGILSEYTPLCGTEPAPVAAVCWRSWHASTDMLSWGLAIANITGEYDMSCHWSVALSVYYSAWNYLKSTRKFRTFIFRPQVRYWFCDGHRGLFVDGHLQMASYNFALADWQYRIQDHGGTHPALGGGLGIGYRLPLGSSGRWAMEFAAGAGVYHLDYDRFVNEPNGALTDRRRRTFVGIDNVGISIVYNFNAFRR